MYNLKEEYRGQYSGLNNNYVLMQNNNYATTMLDKITHIEVYVMPRGVSRNFPREFPDWVMSLSAGGTTLATDRC